LSSSSSAMPPSCSFFNVISAFSFIDQNHPLASQAWA